MMIYIENISICGEENMWKPTIYRSVSQSHSPCIGLSAQELTTHNWSSSKQRVVFWCSPKGTYEDWKANSG
jgi:hypothetical protein